MIIAVDFDGTLARGQYPNIDGLYPNAKMYMQALKKDVHYIIINTCRVGDLLLEAINFLLDNQIPFDRVNDNKPSEVIFFGSNSRKIHADVYIDDKNIGGFPGWARAYELIKEQNGKVE